MKWLKLPGLKLDWVILVICVIQVTFCPDFIQLMKYQGLTKNLHGNGIYILLHTEYTYAIIMASLTQSLIIMHFKGIWF